MSSEVALLLLPILLLGCSSSLAAAVDQFETGRPAEADRAFRRLEEGIPCSPAARARYALYRGLNHLTLGDGAQADRWLSAAKLATDDDPSLLSDAEQGRLLSAWRTLGRMPGEPALSHSTPPTPECLAKTLTLPTLSH